MMITVFIVGASLLPMCAAHGFVTVPMSRNQLICDETYPEDEDPVAGARFTSGIRGRMARNWNYYCKSHRQHQYDQPHFDTPPGTMPLTGPVCAGNMEPRQEGFRLFQAPGAEEVYAAFQTAGAVQGTYRAGDIIETRWQIVANHGGFYSYRLCLDGSDTEECFQNMVLQNETGAAWLGPVDPYRCGRNSAGGCEELPNYALLCNPDHNSCSYTDRLVIPKDISCERCTLSWRWDTGYGEMDNEATIFTNCMDIAILPAEEFA